LKRIGFYLHLGMNVIVMMINAILSNNYSLPSI